MITKWKVTIPELTGSEQRFAYAYVPDAYKKNPDARYPVLYMFDGHNIFFDEDATYGKCWGMKEYLDKTGLPIMVVAVECNHSPDNARLREYSPFTFTHPDLGKITGLGPVTMSWLVNTFKPYIDCTFPTLPDREHTFIGGSSMGGLMSLYGVMEFNHVFSRAAALSPSVWFAENQLARLLASAPVTPDTVIYMDYGSRELPFHKNMKLQFGRVAAKLFERGIMVDCRIVPGGNHNEASWEKQIPFFMHTLLYGID